MSFFDVNTSKPGTFTHLMILCIVIMWRDIFLFVYFWTFVYWKKMAVSFAMFFFPFFSLNKLTSHSWPWLEDTLKLRFPHFFFFFLMKSLNILLIFGHYTWISTYNHIDIIFSQLRKKMSLFIQLVIALRQSHTHDNSLYTRD